MNQDQGAQPGERGDRARTTDKATAEVWGPFRVQGQKKATCNMDLGTIQKTQLETSILQPTSKGQLGDKTKEKLPSTKTQTRTKDPELSLNNAPGPGAAGQQGGAPGEAALGN